MADFIKIYAEKFLLNNHIIYTRNVFFKIKMYQYNYIYLHIIIFILTVL